MNKKPIDYEEDTFSVDEMDNVNIKINPEYYIHHSLIKAQEALIKENLQEGMIQYRFIVEHIQTLCESANLITEDYFNQIEEFKKTEEYTKELKTEVRSTLLANKKLKLLMEHVFSRKLVISPLKAN